MITPVIKLRTKEFLTAEENIFKDFFPIEYPIIPSVENA